MNVGSMKRYKVIAIPFAGGNKQSYRLFQKATSNEIDWVTLELPGRGLRYKEKLLTSFDDMVLDLLKQVRSVISDNDFTYVMYGHSMGSLLGYEIVKKLIEQNLKLPVALVFSGRAGPSIGPDEFLSGLSGPDFWQKINDKGGLPIEVLKSEELMEFYYPIIKADFKAIEGYRYSKPDKPLTLPIHVYMGKEELGEDKTKMDEVNAWQLETKFPLNIQFMDGDHFFIYNHGAEMTKKIIHILKISSKTLLFK